MRFATTALALVLLATPAFANEDQVRADIERIHGDADGFFVLLSDVQQASTYNPLDLAAFALYPLTINANGETYDIQNQQDFEDNFDNLVTQDTLDAIDAQNVGDLIVTSEGVGLANGAVWITNACIDEACSETHWGILSINN